MLQSELDSERWYTGASADLKTCLTEHNSGKSPYTAKFKPWRLMTYIGFDDQQKAVAFERYLKSGSGRAFAIGHLR